MTDLHLSKTTCDDGVELDKRCYLPGIVISCPCPACGRMVERDLGEDYLSYPETGVPKTIHLCCSGEYRDGKDEHEEIEWEVGTIAVRLTVDVVPAEGFDLRVGALT